MDSNPNIPPTDTTILDPVPPKKNGAHAAEKKDESADDDGGGLVAELSSWTREERIALRKKLDKDNKLSLSQERRDGLKRVLDALDKSDPPKVIKNESARRIKINARSGNGVMVLASLEERKIRAEELEQFRYQPWEQLNILKVEAETPRPESTLLGAIPGLAVFYVIAGAATSKIWQTPVIWGWTLSTWYWIVGFLALVILAAWASINKTQRWSTVRRATAQIFSLFITLMVGLALPFATILYYNDMPRILKSLNSLTVLGYTFQWLFIAMASLLPALLYYLFDRHQLGTLLCKFHRDVFRLDPYVTTLADVRSKYGKQMDEMYGSSGVGLSGKLLSDTRWPILVATVLMTLGWFLTLLPFNPAIEIGEASQLYVFFTPKNAPLAYGFLGAYLFGLTMILRRYMLSDLRPKAYSHIAVRIFTVFIVAWLFSEIKLVGFNQGDPVTGAIFKGNPLLLIAFLAGIVPETVLTFLYEKIRPLQILRGTNLKEKQPLTKLEGIDLYDRARLLDEGITSVENLAHHDMVDLMLQTRIPTPRIIDFFDQAILFLHLGGDEDEAEKEDKGGEGGGGGKDEGAKTTFERLRRYGIRTATDLIKISDVLDKPAAVGNGAKKTACELDEIISPQRRKMVLESVRDAEWFDFITHWRNSCEQENYTLNEDDLYVKTTIPDPSKQDAEKSFANPEIIFLQGIPSLTKISGGV
jgi:hypothetical protein